MRKCHQTASTSACRRWALAEAWHPNLSLQHAKMGSKPPTRPLLCCTSPGGEFQPCSQRWASILPTICFYLTPSWLELQEPAGKLQPTAFYEWLLYSYHLLFLYPRTGKSSQPNSSCFPNGQDSCPPRWSSYFPSFKNQNKHKWKSSILLPWLFLVSWEQERDSSDKHSPCINSWMPGSQTCPN